MANTVTEICNAALTRIGVDRITDFAADNSIVAVRCRDNYDIARKAALRAYPWNCATKLETLPAETDAPKWRFARAFKLPDDWLRLVTIDGERDFNKRYRIVGRLIMTEDAPSSLNIEYIFDLTNVAAMDALVTDAIAQRLAATLAYDRTGSAGVAEDKWRVYAGMIREARAIDAQEGSPEPFGPDPDNAPMGWLESRY